jgi:hypothetical protein
VAPSTQNLRDLAARWATAAAAERANYQLYLTELADALGVERPRPAGGGYCFEHPVKVVARDGTEATNFIDLYKAGHFVLEAKDAGDDARSAELLRRAFGQARTYAAAVPGTPPPYLLVVDVGRTLLVWDRWSGSYGGFNAARRVGLANLGERPEDIALLRDIFESPQARDPRARATAVTRAIAARLAALAASLEARGYAPEEVASFLIRCVFTMFAEDIGLLPDHPFQTAVAEIGLRDPDEFAIAVGELWRAMDGGQRFGLRRLQRFNGHFFRDAGTLPLTREDLVVLHEASLSDWASVEPSIFGTLLTRALDPAERHRLGAQFTPRPFVERVVRPTIEAPVRERWTIVQAEVLQLQRTGKRRDRESAIGRLRHFHEWLRSLRILDPACGSGNFLYVALNTLKRIEFEVLRTIEEITGQPELAVDEVGPWQFQGIEVKPWAREVAELCLWVGHFQAWRELHGHAQPPEPVLRDTGSLECRDAVLAWDAVRERPERSRPDPTPRIRHPVTGNLVPDPTRTRVYLEYTNARPADWPTADYIVGNPPYMGNKRMREAFGDGYVDALRAAYPEVPDSADYVMYWWHRAAREIARGRARRAGLITTNSITQTFNRAVVADALADGVGIVWAIPTHPWVDEAGSAAVDVAMTVLERGGQKATRVEVDAAGRVTHQFEADRLNPDLSAHADVPRAAGEPLFANAGLSSRGFTLVGRGFVLDEPEAERLRRLSAGAEEIVRPYMNGRDLAGIPRRAFVIDFGLRTHSEALEHPVLYEIVRDRVKPAREANQRRSYREHWWRFGEPRVTWRDASAGLSRFIATPYVSKHRFFVFLDAVVAPDEKVVCVASDDAFILGVLSSQLHATWALAAGARLEDRPTYNNSLCFDPFPFPQGEPAVRDTVEAVMLRLHSHREEALARSRNLTMTAIYNVVEKLRTGEVLSDAERVIHEAAACGVLRDLHEELDMAVARCYGWSWPLHRAESLSRLVDLHDVRIAEEQAGHVHWLRPDYQVRRFGEGALELPPDAVLDDEQAPEEAHGRTPWPRTAAEQIRALQHTLAAGPLTVEEAAVRFSGARRDLVARHLETLVLLGEVRVGDANEYHAVRDPL